MGNWKRVGSPLLQQYNQIIREGFLLTQGRLSLSFDDNPFGNLRPQIPSFQLLMIHRGHPIEITDSGKFCVKPYGDKRLPGQFTKDKNPCIYDSVSFFLVPWDISLKKDYPGEVIATLDGFETTDGKRNLASLVYISERGMNIDHANASTISNIMPTQVQAHLNHWLYHAGKIQGYNPTKNEWENLGRFDFTSTAQVTQTVTLTLEKRFKTRLRTDQRDY